MEATRDSAKYCVFMWMQQGRIWHMRKMSFLFI